MRGIGIDLVDLNRISVILQRRQDRFLRYAFTSEERVIIERLSLERQATYVAGRWAAKEAILKALGTGIGRVTFQDVMVLPGSDGEPNVTLLARAALRQRELGISQWFVSISHEGNYAIAVAIATEKQI